MVTQSIGYVKSEGGVILNENVQALEGYANSEAMRAAAGLDWDVHTSPLYLHNGERFPSRVGLYRSDNGEPLGIVSDTRYSIDPPGRLFAIGDAITALDEGARWSTAGVINRGGLAAVWASLHIGDLNIAGFEHHNLLFMSTDYDGRLTLSARPTGVRVICQNTFAWALGSAAAFSIRHSAADRDNAIDQAVELLQGATERARRFKSWAETSTQQFAGPEIETAMENLLVGDPIEDRRKGFVTPQGRYVLESRTDAVKAQAKIEQQQKRRQRKLEVYRDEYRTPEYEIGGRNILSLWNSATGWADHQGRVRKVAGATVAEARLNNGMFGAGSQLKTAATRLVVEATGRSIE